MTSPSLRTLTLALLVTTAVTMTSTAATAGRPTHGAPDFGPNVTIFDPGMPVAEIQADPRRGPRPAGRQRDGHRAARLPVQAGHVRHGRRSRCRPRSATTPRSSGLGASPTDVTVNGKLEVYNRCLADGGTGNCLALVNFWRTLSNLSLTINAAGQDGCRSTANFWAVSQAVSMRRLNISGGGLSLMDYCTAGPQYASGGFIADSRLPATTNGSQQQWLTRNSEVGSWSNARVEPGLRGRRGRAGRRRRSPTRRTPRWRPPR